jgi:hypothetical protein
MEVAVPAGRRARTVIRSLVSVADADDRPRRQTLGFGIFGQALAVRRQIVEDPMHPNALWRLRVGSVGIVDDQRQALGALRSAGECERRRCVLALASISRRNLAALLEGRGR